MNITDSAKKYCGAAFSGDAHGLCKTDPEFVERFANFAYDEVVNSDDLDSRTRMMAILAALLGCQGIDEFKVMLPAALNLGVTQVEAKEIASKVDAMIVIGGKNSSNTQKLYEICLNECKNTYYIQTLGDFDPESVNSVRSVGITAGASTPKKIIEEVHTNVRVEF